MSFDFYLSDLLPFHGLQAQFGESPLAMHLSRSLRPAKARE